MAEVKQIQDLTITGDECFSLVPASSTVSISYLTPSGSVEYTDFECYEHSAGTIIKFNSVLPENLPATPWTLNVALDNSNSILHWGTYEENYDAWENIDRNPHVFYAFMESVDTGVTGEELIVTAQESRCDLGSYGPRGYREVTDGIKPTVADLALFAKTSSSDYRPVFGINGTAYIVYSHVHGINMSWRNWPLVTFVGKTLSGAVKQLCEWKALYDAGAVSEKYAHDASKFIENLGITEEMIEELSQTEVMMPTERFMRGYGNPRHGFTETGVFPSSIRNLLMSQLRYRTLTVLETKHPLHPNVDQTLKDKELVIQRKRIIEWFSEFRPNLSLEEMSAQALYEHVFNRRPDLDYPIIVPVPANRKMYDDGLLAARFFDATE